MTETARIDQRSELHKTIWAIAEELRGSVDGWDFKHYVLGTLFYRFISENLCEYFDAQEHAAGNTSFQYARLSDEEAENGRAATVDEKGFFILPSELFCALVACDEVLDNDANLSVSSYVEQPDTREKIDIDELNGRIADIVEREQKLRGEIDAIVADLKG